MGSLLGVKKLVVNQDAIGQIVAQESLGFRFGYSEQKAALASLEILARRAGKASLLDR